MIGTMTNEEYFKVLDEIRNSGLVNMFGSAKPLRDMFPDLSREESKSIVIQWMKSYHKRHHQNENSSEFTRKG